MFSQEKHKPTSTSYSSPQNTHLSNNDSIMINIPSLLQNGSSTSQNNHCTPAALSSISQLSHKLAIKQRLVPQELTRWLSETKSTISFSSPNHNQPGSPPNNLQQIIQPLQHSDFLSPDCLLSTQNSASANSLLIDGIISDTHSVAQAHPPTPTVQRVAYITGNQSNFNRQSSTSSADTPQPHYQPHNDTPHMPFFTPPVRIWTQNELRELFSSRKLTDEEKAQSTPLTDSLSETNTKGAWESLVLNSSNDWVKSAESPLPNQSKPNYSMQNSQHPTVTHKAFITGPFVAAAGPYNIKANTPEQSKWDTPKEPLSSCSPSSQKYHHDVIVGIDSSRCSGRIISDKPTQPLTKNEELSLDNFPSHHSTSSVEEYLNKEMISSQTAEPTDISFPESSLNVANCGAQANTLLHDQLDDLSRRLSVASIAEEKSPWSASSPEPPCTQAKPDNPPSATFKPVFNRIDNSDQTPIRKKLTRQLVGEYDAKFDLDETKSNPSRNSQPLSESFVLLDILPSPLANSSAPPVKKSSQSYLHDELPTSEQQDSQLHIVTHEDVTSSNPAVFSSVILPPQSQPFTSLHPDLLIERQNQNSLKRQHQERNDFQRPSPADNKKPIVRCNSSSPTIRSLKPSDDLNKAKEPSFHHLDLHGLDNTADSPYLLRSPDGRIEPHPSSNSDFPDSTVPLASPYNNPLSLANQSQTKLRPSKTIPYSFDQLNSFATGTYDPGLAQSPAITSSSLKNTQKNNFSDDESIPPSPFISESLNQEILTSIETPRAGPLNDSFTVDELHPPNHTHIDITSGMDPLQEEAEFPPQQQPVDNQPAVDEAIGDAALPLVTPQIRYSDNPSLWQRIWNSIRSHFNRGLEDISARDVILTSGIAAFFIIASIILGIVIAFA